MSGRVGVGRRATLALALLGGGLGGAVGAAAPGGASCGTESRSLELVPEPGVIGIMAPEENIKQLSAILRGGDKDRRRAAFR